MLLINSPETESHLRLDTEIRSLTRIDTIHAHAIYQSKVHLVIAEKFIAFSGSFVEHRTNPALSSTCFV